MSLIRWRPGQSLDRWDSFANDIGHLRQEMDRLFSHLMVPGYDVEPGESIFPSAELQDQGDHLALRLEVPGMKPEEVDIQVSEDTVSIKGERKSEETTEEDGMTRSEFHYGKFSRTIALPKMIKPNEVVADYKDGILSLTMPKEDKDTPKSVKVEVKHA